MFCINPHCNVPFHLQLTDTILIHGGTLELVQIFNHIGAVASFLLKAVAKARKEHGVHRELTPNAFRVVMRDNLDIIYTKPCSGVHMSVLQDKAGMEHLMSVLNPCQFQVSLKQPNPPLRLWIQEHFHLSYVHLLNTADLEVHSDDESEEEESLLSSEEEELTACNGHYREQLENEVEAS